MRRYAVWHESDAARGCLEHAVTLRGQSRSLCLQEQCWLSESGLKALQEKVSCEREDDFGRSHGKISTIPAEQSRGGPPNGYFMLRRTQEVVLGERCPAAVLTMYPTEPSGLAPPPLECIAQPPRAMG